ncbi:type III-B CRISPR module RAMP protein Cmr6 [Endozoicomonas montiporae]|uniref:Cmr6 family CRISPR-associated RAMP protein n=1 Tax=Endozoicomonas montiporae CL-33 TaxID=570277 RepID=A0A142BBU5_9GAMM|nr:type III-B CRISPR module RAMP protein Cmr6 [Endozoicomonas montiporae]AMO56221.1 Cmr6 family CRISPR-associated RAMP protein [Endozoicomonas montiporae CL-33]
MTLKLPLYNQSECSKPAFPYHKGLWFERFFSYPDKWTVDYSGRDKNKSRKTEWISGIAGSCGDGNEITRFAERQVRLVSSLEGQYRVYELDWHFVTGMGNPHPVENGFLWHPTLGTPYLQGSSIKGLLRSWMEEQGADKALLHRWFGSESKDSKVPKDSTEQKKDNQAGSLIFHDAVPTKQPVVGLDIMTPHMDKWYEKGGSGQPADKHQTIPADWHNPVPVPFLVTKNASFLFAVSPRTEAMKEDMGKVMDELAKALEWLGVGSKTSVGYGSMSPDLKAEEGFANELAEHLEKEQEEKHKSALSPAQLSLFHLEQQLISDKNSGIKNAGGACKQQLNEVKNQAVTENWTFDDLEALRLLAINVLKQHGPDPKKGKGKELMKSIRALQEQAK